MNYKDVHFIFAVITLRLVPIHAQNRNPVVKMDVPLDSIRLSDPFILADKPTATYCMTGTGGMLWKSKDLKKWTGPYPVAKTNPASWMGKNPMIWADLSGSIGKGKLLSRASDSPWSREKNEEGKIVPNKVTDGP